MRKGRFEVSRWFLLLAAFLWYRDESGVAAQGLLACALHEAGHLAALRILRVPVAGIRVTVFGAQITTAGGMSYRQEFFAAAAGPGVNLVLAFLASRFSKLLMFAGENLVLATFNLLPVGGLDGARMLSSLLHLLCPEETARRMCDAADIICSAFFVAAGFLTAFRVGNMTLCLVTLWILKRPGLKKETVISKKKEKGLVMRCGNG